MARVVADYATPWRLLMLAFLGAGLFLAVVLENVAIRVTGIGLAVLSVFALLAQLSRQIDRAPVGRRAAARAAPPDRAPHVPSRSVRPIVSVVIVGRNDSSFAADCIRSLQTQELQNFEAVIVDDASTDSTLEALIEAIGDDHRFRIIRTGRSVGFGLARNHGVAASSAKYVTFLDLHDFLAPSALASRVALAEQQADRPSVAGSYCGHEEVDADATPEGWIPDPVAGREATVSRPGRDDDTFTIASAPLIRRDVFESMGGFDGSSAAEDIWLKALRAGFTIVGTGIAGVAHRQNASSDAVETAIATADVPARPVRRPVLLPVTPESLRDFRTGRPILLLPAAGYHTDELIELTDEMRRRGFAPVAMLDRRNWAAAGVQLSRVDVPALEALEPGDWLHEFEAILTFNDWWTYYGEYVQYLHGAPTVSFAKVEGVQDWFDVDTGRARDAYLASDVVLCQGNNDVRALEGRRDNLELVGSSRLEAIWNEPLPADASPRVVGNVNFTYGVQTEHRDLWVDTLRQACERAGVPLDLSLHPAERSAHRDLASDRPLRHLVTTDSILVSRFSTVLFEGMARGCSVIYYNPHGERVPTFKDPSGAFDVAEDVEALSELIRRSMTSRRAEAKERARAFFMEQVSIVDGVLPAVRTADAIERHLGR